MKQLTKYLALSAGLLLATTACSPKLSKQKGLALSSYQDSVAYSFGVLNGQAFSEVLSRMPGDTLNRQQILSAFGDILLGRTTQVTAATAKAIFEKYAAGLKQAELRQVAASTDSLLAANKKKDGVKVTQTGLQYRVLRGVQGVRPTAQDTVVVQYKGTLPSGTEFDSSYKRGEPAVFPLTQVIPGWTEGICLMTKGSKYEFLIPPALAYGERGVNGVIPGGSPLFFEVELLDVRPYKEPASTEEQVSESATTPAKLKAVKPRKLSKRKK
ncbi:FKBP-type peptidyl-prolyl cis-trans isomerase [Porphyromonas sp.]